MTSDREGSGTTGAPDPSRPPSLRETWLRVRTARDELGSAKAAFEEALAKRSAALALERTSRPARQEGSDPAVEGEDISEPLSEDEAARIFLGSALQGAPGLEEEAAALRRRLELDDAAQPDIDQAVLVLARNHVFGDNGSQVWEDEQPLEHREWVGEDYSSGIGGQRVAVMGFSHWGELDEDRACVTEEVIAAVCDGRSHAFFDQIQRYFGFGQRAEFWSRVAFFNYLPDLVGTGENRHAWGRQDQHDRARVRFQQILDRRQPDKVIVFSMKAWDSMPAFRPADPSGRSLGRDGEFPRSFGWGTYDAGLDGHVTAAFGLRHPQGALKEIMVNAVRRAMETDVPR